MTVDELAERMYTERVAERGPAWHQLGDVTQSVWRAIALKEMFG